MEERVRIIIEVRAGVIPDKPMPEYSKRFIITEKDWEDTSGNAVMEKYGYAQEYMRNLWRPEGLNWVRCDWIYL